MTVGFKASLQLKTKIMGTVTRSCDLLTLPNFGFSYRLSHKIFLGPSSFRDRDLCCDFWAGAVPGARHRLKIDDPIAGTIRVVDRNAIVERHREGVGVSVKKEHAFVHAGMTMMGMRR
jgi:hypothetical protein